MLQLKLRHMIVFLSVIRNDDIVWMGS